MAKKIILISLLAAAVLGILYYSNIAFIRIQNQKVQDELQTQIDQLKKDRLDLENKMNNIQKENITQDTNQNGVLELTDVQIQSNEIYNEGTVKGAIYGKFNAVARVKNVTNSDLNNVTVTSLFLKNTFNGKTINVDSKTQKIDKLSPGEEKEVVFLDYRVDHPEVSQELIVNVFHSSISDINDTSNLKKINIRAAFPPGSND